LFVMSHYGAQLQVLHAYTLELITFFISLEQELIEYTYDHDVLDLANLETTTIFDVKVLADKSIALFTTNGTVLIMQQSNSNSYKIKHVVKLLGSNGEVDEDSLAFSNVQIISQRLGMFLITCSEGSLVYQICVENSD
jgi:hypothetical protein